MSRFRLVEGAAGGFRLAWNDVGADIEAAWFSQALSLFHSRGISLEEDLSVYHLVVRWAWLDGDVDRSPSKCQKRRQHPIYLFVHPPPLEFSDDKNGNDTASYTAYYTSSLHFWSFREDGQSRLSPELCFDFGLPVQLQLNDHGLRASSWNTENYKRIHEYQLARGFDPTTIYFAQHIKFDHVVFQPINDSDRSEDLNTEHSDSSNGSDNSKFLVCTSCSQVFCMSCGQVQRSASHTRIGELTTTMQNTEIEIGGIQMYHHPEQHKNNSTNVDWAKEEQNLRLVQPLSPRFSPFTSPVNSHSLESADPYQGYQSQIHPAGYNVNQEYFVHPFLSEILSSEDASVTAHRVNTPASVASNQLSMFISHAEWLRMSQYMPLPDPFDEPPIFNSSNADHPNMDNDFTGNTTNSDHSEPIVSLFSSGTTTAYRQSDNTAQGTGWPGTAQIGPLTAGVNAFDSTLMLDPLVESPTFSSFEAGLANPVGNGFDMNVTSSVRSEPTHISSVDTTTTVAGYFDPTAQGVEWGSSDLAPSGSTGIIDAVNGYPLSYPMQVDTGPHNSTHQTYPSLPYHSDSGYALAFSYHGGGPAERSQEQFQGQTYDPGTVSDEQMLPSWNGWSGDSNDGSIAGGW
ncbi:hypothetical protein PM082_006244 [Marasmius tenuissimus]|nr:hypothetical protein PM082_006244 [Marasmius tenuissimus]